MTDWTDRLGMLATTTVVGLFLLAGIMSGYYYWMNRPLPLREPIQIQIRDGMTGYQIGRLLEKRNVVPSAEEFRWALWFLDAERDLTGGAVRLEPPMTMRQLVRTLQEKHPLLIRVLIKEGWPSWKIYERLHERLEVPVQDFERRAGSSTFLRSVGISTDHIEGYLFPDTYFFSSEAGAREVLTHLVDRFFEVVHDLKLRRRARKLGYSLDEVVRLASLVEREARLATERRLISAVFHNRLKRGMPLQADPTLLYHAGDFQQPITHRMLQKRTPYNTYRRRGLPPTPICNPGRASLEASVDPASVSYLYFVARGDGSHVFSRTYRQHRRAVRKYQE